MVQYKEFQRYFIMCLLGWGQYLSIKFLFFNFLARSFTAKSPETSKFSRILAKIGGGN